MPGQTLVCFLDYGHYYKKNILLYEYTLVQNRLTCLVLIYDKEEKSCSLKHQNTKTLFLFGWGVVSLPLSVIHSVRPCFFLKGNVVLIFTSYKCIRTLQRGEAGVAGSRMNGLYSVNIQGETDFTIPSLDRFSPIPPKLLNDL